MPTLEGLQRRLGALDNILGIVRTMKALAAVNMPAAARAAASAATFHRSVLDGLSAALRAHPQSDASLCVQRGAWPIVIAFGTDHGLCGGFNETLARHVAGAAEGPGAIFAVGGRLAGALERDGVAVARVFRAAAASDGLQSLADELILAMEEAAQRRPITVEIAHHVKASGGGTTVERSHLLPLRRTDLARRPWPTRRVPLLLAPGEATLTALSRLHVAIGLFRAGARSLEAEHATRFALMSQAETELEARLNEVGAAHRLARQAGITDELMDVVSGFEAIGADRTRASRSTGPVTRS